LGAPTRWSTSAIQLLQSAPRVRYSHADTLPGNCCAVADCALAAPWGPGPLRFFVYKFGCVSGSPSGATNAVEIFAEGTAHTTTNWGLQSGPRGGCSPSPFPWSALRAAMAAGGWGARFPCGGAPPPGAWGAAGRENTSSSAKYLGRNGESSSSTTTTPPPTQELAASSARQAACSAAARQSSVRTGRRRCSHSSSGEESEAVTNMAKEEDGSEDGLVLGCDRTKRASAEVGGAGRDQARLCGSSFASNWGWRGLVVWVSTGWWCWPCGDCLDRAGGRRLLGLQCSAGALLLRGGLVAIYMLRWQSEI
jgi:hypothetical protein